MTTDGIDTERFTEEDSSPDTINTRVFLDQVFFRIFRYVFVFGRSRYNYIKQLSLGVPNIALLLKPL